MRTTFLFAIPNFISGCARILDIGGVYDIYNESRDGDEADARAIYSDFRMVGQDLQWAMEIYRTAHRDKISPQDLSVALQQENATVRHDAND